MNIGHGFDRLHASVCDLGGLEEPVYGHVPALLPEGERMVGATIAATTGEIRSVTLTYEHDPPVPVAAHLITLTDMDGCVVAQRGLALGWNVAGIQDRAARLHCIMQQARWRSVEPDHVTSVLWDITIGVDTFTPDEA